MLCRAQDEGFDDAEMTRFIASQMRAFQIPGAAVGIVRGSEIIYLKGFGAADETGRRITPQTPFLIGSNSKSFTALAVMQLVWLKFQPDIWYGLVFGAVVTILHTPVNAFLKSMPSR